MAGETEASRRTPAAPASHDSLAAWWAVTGVVLLLTNAAIRLGARGVETIRAGLGPGQWIALVVLTTGFVYGEGVRALQRRFAPHVVARARRLDTRAPLLLRVLAPLYAFGLVGEVPRRILLAWAGVAAIVAAVLIVRAFPEPWRGITDFAVAAAVGWGAVALLVHALRTLR